MEKTKTIQGALIGFILGVIFEILHMLRYYFWNAVPQTCSYTELQKFLGITPLCINIYFFGIWFAIIGGIIGYFIKTNGGKFFSSQA